uniref:non-specific serine/threonine protein kinase n=1 Tax=Oryza glumipatula TaxID=40148 RepID=A0A0D9Y3R3_9ORYZ
MSRYKPLSLLLPLLLLLHTHQLIIVPCSSATAATYANLTGALPPAVPCLPDQASALLRLKRSFSITRNSTYVFRSGDGRVTSLDLGGRRLKSGGLDPALFHLTSLKHLNLACNSFNGSQLPHTGIEQLTKLTHLNLSSCDFMGQLPTASISRLTDLVSLDLSTRFEATELIDGHTLLNSDSTYDPIALKEPNFKALIANHKKMRELRLGAVDLSDNGLTWCAALASSTPNLQVLSLPLSQLSGPICISLSSMHSLAVIDLRFNGLSGPIPNFATFSSLRVLQLGHNFLQGHVSPLIFQHKKLVTIDLCYNAELSGSLPNFSVASNLENILVTETSFYGEIPSSMGNLKSLKNLGLGASQFSGKLPSSIGWLKALNSLEISGTTIEGAIPSWITNLTLLTALQFSECGLTGSIPFFLGKLTKLRKLALYKCKFSGKLPQRISNFTELSILFLNSNNFVGTVKLASLWGLQHLRYLDISDNNLVVVDGKVNSSLAHIPKLQMLSLSGCNITKFPNFLRSQDELLWLDLSKNQIQGAIPSWAWESWNDAGTATLNLADNKFTSVGSSPFIPLKMDWLCLKNNMFEGTIPIPQGSASILDYSNNKFSSIPFNFTAHLSHVTLFNAHGNNLSGEIPPSFCSATEFQVLDLSRNNFSGSIPSCLIENVNGIQILNLNANQLHGEFPDTIKEGCSFHALYFSGNKIEGRLPRSLVACQNLEILDAGNNQIYDIFPCWMSTLRRLQVLVLKSNKFFGHVVQSLTDEESTCAFPNAIIIDLSSNNFFGPLPKDKSFKRLELMLHRDTNTSLVMDHVVSNLGVLYAYTASLTYKGHYTTFAKILRTLVFIDFSNNAFSGSIPKVVGELDLLHGLNMSHNFLTGPIPSQLGGLKQLEALDLSSNQLSGAIPQELASLDFLGMLNLSNNKLEGKIPESPHFASFTNSSFLGNNGLCGPPLSNGCSNMTVLNVIPSKEKSVDIVLFLFSGLGFGLGFAIAVAVSWRIPIRKWSTVRQRAL